MRARSGPGTCSLWWLLTAASAAPAAAQSDPPAAAPSTKLHGRVIDEQGKPLAGAAVRAVAYGDFVDTVELLAKPTAVTGADGRYTLESPAKMTWGSVVIAAPGKQACACQFHVDRHSLDDVLLMPGARISGRVRDDSGAPLAGVRIRIESGIDDRFSSQVRLLAGARSDDRGIFSVPCVPRTGLRLIAEADGHLTESRLVAQDSAVDVSLHKVGMVRGKVVDAAGKPLAGITVTATTVEPRFALGNVITGPDGTFAVTVPSRSRFRLAAQIESPETWLSSGLLHGPADGVVVAPVTGTSAKTIQVTVVDAGTKAPIRRFQLSQQHVDPTLLQIALFHHGVNRRAYEGQASIEVDRHPGQPLVIVVEAPGHAFEVVPVPDQLDKPLTVALGPEAVLVGRVTDAATGKAMAGVAVRALPKGNSSGSGGTAENAGPLSDADGNYRIGGLRPGEYVVQTHAALRGASAVLATTVKVGTETRLDVTVPKEEWLEIDITGEVPAGVAYSLSIGNSMSSSAGGFQHYMPAPAPMPLTKAGRYRLGPVIPGTAMLQLFAPSRTRIGSGTTMQLGRVSAGVGPLPIALPDLTIQTVQGGVELPPEVATERVAVIATMAARGEGTPRHAVAGVGGDGRFTIDLPAGSYCLQCVDLLTGIVFHTEEEDVVVGAASVKVTLRPACQWLEVDCRPQQPGAEVLLQSFHVQVNRPRSGSSAAFLNSFSGVGTVEVGLVECRGGAQQQWLVPAGPIEVRAMQSFGMLEPWSHGHQAGEVARANTDVTQREQRVVLEIPAPPNDEEILRRRKN